MVNPITESATLAPIANAIIPYAIFLFDMTFNGFGFKLLTSF